MATEGRQHGVKGVYYGGDWLDLKDCEGTFNVSEENCSGCTHPPVTSSSSSSSSGRLRSVSRTVATDGSASKSTTTKKKSSSSSSSSNIILYDVCIIGAGCIGAAVARELSKYQLRILWLEAADDVSQGATKGNSGIVHAGYDDEPGTNRAKYCWAGNQMFRALDKDLRFGYQTNGSLVIATKESDRAILQELLERGHVNGVERLRIIESREELRRMEPYVNDNAIAALYSPDAGNVIPYEYTIALAENAVDNGVELKIRRHVTAIAPTDDDKGMIVTAQYWEPQPYLDSTASQQRTKDERYNILSRVFLAVATVGLPVLLKQDYRRGELFGAILLLVFIVLGYGRSGKGDATVSKSTPLSTLVGEAGEVLGKPGDAGTKVTVEDMFVGGSGSARIQKGVPVATETYQANYVINCAGGASDQVARLIGDESFKIKPRVGDYLLLNRNQGHLAKQTLFPCPDPVLGKGVLVQTTLWGNLILGPTARDMHQAGPRDMTSAQIQEYILSKCKELVPTFDAKETIHAFCGARAKSDRGDWIIEPSVKNGRMIHVAGIDSPGLAGSPAIALEVVRLLQEAGCTLSSNPNFNPRRAPIITPKKGLLGLKMTGDITKADEVKMEANVICKCEKVTELEVVRALRRSLPIDSTQAIRKRTRAGMGHCQGDPENYNCEARVKAIIARECGMPMNQIGGRPWPATSTLTQRWPDAAEKKELEQRMMMPSQ